ncbi:MAG: hypothetical protein ACP5I8_11520 [Phycisphaerae bacterium]
MNITRVKKLAFETIGDQQLTRRERDLVLLGAVFQTATDHWPIERALREIRACEPSGFEVRDYPDNHLRPYASRIIEKLKADGARVYILDEPI